MITTPSFAWCIEKPTAVEIENRNIANIIDLISKKKKKEKWKCNDTSLTVEILFVIIN